MPCLCRCVSDVLPWQVRAAAMIFFWPITVSCVAFKVARAIFEGSNRSLSGLASIAAYLVYMAQSVPFLQLFANYVLRLVNPDGAALDDLPAVKDVAYEEGRATRVREAQPNMTLDVYPLPAGRNGPVIVFVYGGGFCHGEKWFYYKMARRLRKECGAVVVVPDYPTYPRGTIQEQSESIARALIWTRGNAARFGGSADHIWVIGHSAGGFLSTYTVLRSMMAKASGSNGFPNCMLQQKEATPAHDFLAYLQLKGNVWNGSRRTYPANDLAAMPSPNEPIVDYSKVPRVEGVLLLAGVSDVGDQVNTLEKRRGLDRVCSTAAATGGYWDATDIPALCRYLAVNTAAYPITAEMAPRNGFKFLHGSQDADVDLAQSQALADAMRELGQATHTVLSPYLGVTPTSFSHVGMVMDLCTVVCAGKGSFCSAADAAAANHPTMVYIKEAMGKGTKPKVE